MHIMQLSLLSSPTQYAVGAGSYLVIYSDQEEPYTDTTLLAALGVSSTTRFPAYGYVYVYPGGEKFLPIMDVTIQTNSLTVRFRTTPTAPPQELPNVGITDTVVQVV